MILSTTISWGGQDVDACLSPGEALWWGHGAAAAEIAVAAVSACFYRGGCLATLRCGELPPSGVRPCLARAPCIAPHDSMADVPVWTQAC